MKASVTKELANIDFSMQNERPTTVEPSRILYFTPPFSTSTVGESCPSELSGSKSEERPLGTRVQIHLSVRPSVRPFIRLPHGRPAVWKSGNWETQNFANWKSEDFELKKNFRLVSNQPRAHMQFTLSLLKGLIQILYALLQILFRLMAICNLLVLHHQPMLKHLKT